MAKGGLLSDLQTEPLNRQNRLFYGDNLKIMEKMPLGCVDMIYLDPPFNSNRTYNLIYTQLTGATLPEQENAFCDTWELDAQKIEMLRNMEVTLEDYGIPKEVAIFWKTWISSLRDAQPKLLAYLLYMTIRLALMARILKPTGSLFLHCDPAASHYIKVILDGIFGHENFRNEVIWKRTSAHSSANRCGPVHDTIFFYTKSNKYTWNPIYQAYDKEYLTGRFKRGNDKPWKDADLTGSGTRNGETGTVWRGFDPTPKGRHWAYPPARLDAMDAAGLIYWPKKVGGWPREKVFLTESRGVPLQDIWADIAPINSQAKERLGYPTQKPITLLTRIIEMASNPGDVVFDPFCGCGTTIYAAQSVGRKWVGCDIAIWSISIVKNALDRRYGLQNNIDYKVDGIPLTVEGARELFADDPLHFQDWAVETIGGFVNTRKSGDRGVDGRIWWQSGSANHCMVISVKGGQLNPGWIRDLVGAVDLDTYAEMGGFICLREPTLGMRQTVADAGMYHFNGASYPRIQIRTVADIIAGKTFITPAPIKLLGWEKQGVLAL